METIDLTIFGICFNGYGRFVDNWLQSIDLQDVKPKEIIIVLGKDHGLDEGLITTRYKGLNVKLIDSDSVIIGTLRNVAIKEISTKWMLYISIDDQLVSGAIKGITPYMKRYHAIALGFLEKNIDPLNPLLYTGVSFGIEGIEHWRTKPVPGYIAVQREFSGEILYYEDVDTPNYPYLFNIAAIGMHVLRMSAPQVIYIKRENSHSDKAIKENQQEEYSEYIDSRVSFYQSKSKLKLEWL